MSKFAPILLVDDDIKLLKLLQTFLEKNGFSVITATSGEECVEIFNYTNPSLCILDVMMQGISGFETLEQIKQKGIKTPIIMLSAIGEVEDRIKGLKIGADDYIIKPFNPNELLLRIQNLLNRIYPTYYNSLIDLGSALVNVNTSEIKIGNSIKHMSFTEKELFVLLANNMGQVLSKDTIYNTLNKTCVLENENSIAVHILRLREKLEDNENSSLLKTIRGKGYMLISASN